METMSAFHLVLSGDIRRSRDLPDRPALQRRLEGALRRVNERFASSLTVPLSVVQGDAFQGLVGDISALIPLIITLEHQLAPATFRSGLGWGRLSTEMRGSTASMDGEAFHLARTALDQAREADHWLVVHGLSDDDEIIANGLAALLGATRRGWTASQQRAVSARRRHPSGKEAAVAAAISAPAMSRALRAAHYNEVLEAEVALGRLLARSTEGTP